MTRKEHLEFCNKCLNRKFDSKHGMICNVTGKIADFEESCVNFKLDEAVKESVNETTEINNEEVIIQLDDIAINKLKFHQDFYYAIVGGLLATIISAIIWAVVTVATEYQIGYMALGVGLLVGFSVRFFGAGIDKKFGYLGAFLSLLGCLLGNLFSQVGFIAQEQYLGYLETLSYLNLELIISILAESFNPMDLLFYGIAVYEGYKFAFRKVTASEIEKLQKGDYEGNPSNYKIRMPLVIVSIVLIVFFIFKINKGVSGIKTFQYDSGEKMSEGELVNSKEQGKWTYWYENGNVQLIGYYSDGIPDSLWQWYDESGNIIKSGNYKKGLEHGIWVNYYGKNSVSDSGSYMEGRMQGAWKYWFENGDLYQTGYFNRNLPDSIWKTYYENGLLNNEGYMEEGNLTGLWTNYYTDGQIASNIKYMPNNNVFIENVWDTEGNQIVIDGNGLFKSFSIDNKLTLQGKVENGLKVGKWISYFENGEVNEEGIYENEIYKIINSWDPKGVQHVKDGHGLYKTYYADKKSIFETGKVESGLREGVWKIYFESSEIVYQQQNYLKGKLNGLQIIYYESGQLYSSGEMKDGLREGEWNWFYVNGNVSSTVNFIEDKKEGKQIMWSETGDKTKEEFYKNGDIIEEKILFGN